MRPNQIKTNTKARAKLHGGYIELYIPGPFSLQRINIKFFIYLCIANTNIFNDDDGTLVNIHFANVFIKFGYAYLHKIPVHLYAHNKHGWNCYIE